MSKEDTKLGYEFEDEIKKNLRELQEKHPIFWHPFIDSRAASKFVASQPSDFLVSGLGKPTYLLEAKASCLKPSLVSCAKSHIRPAQIGWHKKWHRAGNDSWFTFYCEADNFVEFWDGQHVCDCISNGKKLDASVGLIRTCDYFELKDCLRKILT